MAAHPAAQIAHVREKGLHATLIRRKALREFHLTVEPAAGETIASMVRRLHAFLAAHDAVLVRQEVFGLRSAAPEFFERTIRLTEAIKWPVLWLEGRPIGRQTIAGIHAFAVAGAELQWLFSDGRPVASVFSDGYCRHCVLGGVIPYSEGDPNSEQADEVFDEIERQLSRARMSWKNVARTWFYLDGLLDWYGDFNHVRKDAFDGFDVFSQCMPASTGIGASNVDDAVLTAGAWAVQPLGPNAGVKPVISPLQCSARDYGSCFSRAVEITTPDMRRVLISGTASISRDGITQHRNDLPNQLTRTFEVVDAILKSRALHWLDVSRATAYLKHAADAPELMDFLARHGLNLPLVVTEADICRDELLFEIELDALVAPRRRYRADWKS